MTFTALPPEIVSAQMYAGPGSDSMLAAASAWSQLAAALGATATSWQSTIAGLASEEWLGPASSAMITAANPHLGWLTAAAAHAEHTAAHVRMAATGFEQAHAMVVPPPNVAANRALLQHLVATNFLGQNAGSIAATEAQYGEMWAQNCLAMDTYAAQSLAAGRLEPFAQPSATTEPAGMADQATAVSRAAGDAAATKTVSSVRGELGTLAESAHPNPAPVIDQTAAGNASDVFNDPGLKFGQTGVTQSLNTASLGANGVNAVWRGLSGVVGAAKLMADGAKAAGTAAVATGAAQGAAAAASGLGGLGTVAGGLGNAGMIGGLSVPPSWAAPATLASSFGPVSGGTWQAVGGSGLVSEVAPHGLPGMPGVPAAGTAAGMAARGGGGFGMAPRYGFKVPVMPRVPGIG
ncbi:MAG TPA: PPE family protein [Mycobacterium sp.]|nr:PPE family protein [Mycobacterium sp.]